MYMTDPGSMSIADLRAEILNINEIIDANPLFGEDPYCDEQVKLRFYRRTLANKTRDEDARARTRALTASRNQLEQESRSQELLRKARQLANKRCHDRPWHGP